MSALFDYVWKPKTVEDSIDAGVHPAVAKLRMQEAGKQRTVNESLLQDFCNYAWVHAVGVVCLQCCLNISGCNSWEEMARPVSKRS